VLITSLGALVGTTEVTKRMGYIKHHAIIVIDSGYGDGIVAAHAEALRVFAASEGLGGRVMASVVGPIISSPVNGYRSFYIAPDGSKEGWSDSDAGDVARDQLIAWLGENRESLG